MSFTARANDQGGKRPITLSTPEFIRRFLLHVLPGGIQRIRRYGVLANGCKKTQLAQARQALQQPAPNPLATESARDFMARVARIEVNAYPCCQEPLKVVQSLAGVKHLPATGQKQQHREALQHQVRANDGALRGTRVQNQTSERDQARINTHYAKNREISTPMPSFDG